MPIPRNLGATQRGLACMFLLALPWTFDVRLARLVRIGGLRPPSNSWHNRPFHAVRGPVAGSSDPPQGGPGLLNEVWDFLHYTQAVPEEAVLHLSLMAEIAHIEQREIFRQALAERGERRRRRDAPAARQARAAQRQQSGPAGQGGGPPRPA